MNAQLDIDWAESNKRALEAELDRLSSLLRTFARGGARDEDAPSAAGIRTTLDVLCERFGLSEFERNVLLLAAGVELDADIAALCAELHEIGRAHV